MMDNTNLFKTYLVDRQTSNAQHYLKVQDSIPLFVPHSIILDPKKREMESSREITENQIRLKTNQNNIKVPLLSNPTPKNEDASPPLYENVQKMDQTIPNLTHSSGESSKRRNRSKPHNSCSMPNVSPPEKSQAMSNQPTYFVRPETGSSLFGKPPQINPVILTPVLATKSFPKQDQLTEHTKIPLITTIPVRGDHTLTNISSPLDSTSTAPKDNNLLANRSTSQPKSVSNTTILSQPQKESRSKQNSARTFKNPDGVFVPSKPTHASQPLSFVVEPCSEQPSYAQLPAQTPTHLPYTFVPRPSGSFFIPATTILQPETLFQDPLSTSHKPPHLTAIDRPAVEATSVAADDSSVCDEQQSRHDTSTEDGLDELEDGDDEEYVRYFTERPYNPIHRPIIVNQHAYAQHLLDAAIAEPLFVPDLPQSSQVDPSDIPSYLPELSITPHSSLEGRSPGLLSSTLSTSSRRFADADSLFFPAHISQHSETTTPPFRPSLSTHSSQNMLSAMDEESVLSRSMHSPIHSASDQHGLSVYSSKLAAHDIFNSGISFSKPAEHSLPLQQDIFGLNFLQPSPVSTSRLSKETVLGGPLSEIRFGDDPMSDINTLPREFSNLNLLFPINSHLQLPDDESERFIGVRAADGSMAVDC
ncbi:hypothetical protein BLNAU_16602 [Blattamonas nauphoetae]|uniref:Uncharacterized protein n=1 Tax=Blattamonas nauphoetae TaxID=2049346 RepID=A0ABQ9XAZ8_9EUKA|nr:hypothetical protein BLNAU_16602 [Blattamonas nauphoetae]